jgi:hypothetical protein
MMNVLSKYEGGHLILGESAEQQTAFYLVTIHLGWNGRHRFGIGLCSEEYGLKPHLLLQPELSQLLLGFNHEVVAVGVKDRNIHFRILLDSLFHSFLALEQCILIFHEIGVNALDNRGQAIWEYEADVIEDFEIIGNHLNLTFMAAHPTEGQLQHFIREVNQFLQRYEGQEEVKTEEVKTKANEVLKELKSYCDESVNKS